MAGGFAAVPDGAGRMAVTQLSLTDFRCYQSLRLQTDGRTVVLTGPNGAGKTNLLEAISYLAPGRGLRRAQLSEVDRRNGLSQPLGHWVVAANVVTSEGAVEVGTGHDAGCEHGDRKLHDGRRVVRIDGKAVRGQAILARLLSVTWLIPEMDRIFVEGSSARRRFLDRLVYGFDPDHARRVSRYQHALRERSRLLRDGFNRLDPAWLSALEGNIAGDGVAIAAARRDVAHRLARTAAVGPGPFPKADLRVSGSVEQWLEEMPALAAEDRLRGALHASRADDAHTGGASAGPHRSDLAVSHLETGRCAAQCSTGEQKALLISIVLAHSRLRALEQGAPPILLLDEVAAHLDGARREALFGEICASGAQAWLTGTDDAIFAELDGKAQLFRVADATVTPR